MTKKQIKDHLERHFYIGDEECGIIVGGSYFVLRYGTTSHNIAIITVDGVLGRIPYLEGEPDVGAITNFIYSEAKKNKQGE